MKITDIQVNRDVGYGPEITVMNSLYGPEKAVEWIRGHISDESEDAFNKTDRCMEWAHRNSL